MSWALASMLGACASPAQQDSGNDALDAATVADDAVVAATDRTANAFDADFDAADATGARDAADATSVADATDTVVSDATTDASATTFAVPPAACTGAGAVASIGIAWQTSAQFRWLPSEPLMRAADATDYRNLYSYPTTPPTPQPFPSAASGSKPVISIGRGYYLALGFTVPASATGLGLFYENVGSASPLAAFTISECPGDFGQANTHIVNQYCKSDRYGGGGLEAFVGTAIATCPLEVGRTYYLNIIHADLPPAGSTDALPTQCATAQCTAQIELTH